MNNTLYNNIKPIVATLLILMIIGCQGTTEDTSAVRNSSQNNTSTQKNLTIVTNGQGLFNLEERFTFSAKINSIDYALKDVLINANIDSSKKLPITESNVIGVSLNNITFSILANVDSTDVEKHCISGPFSLADTSATVTCYDGKHINGVVTSNPSTTETTTPDTTTTDTTTTDTTDTTTTNTETTITPTETPPSTETPVVKKERERELPDLNGDLKIGR